MRDDDIAKWALFLGFFIVVGVLRALVRAARSSSDLHARQLEEARVGREQRRAMTERRAAELMVEFPQFTDANIVQLLRDELISRGSAQPTWLEWATEETVARVRRNVVLTVIRNERDGR